MWIGVVSLFPEMFQAVTEYGITGRAVENGILTLDYWSPRDFAVDRHKTVDDKPYGGGPGMLMKVQPLRDAISAAKSKSASLGIVEKSAGVDTRTGVEGTGLKNARECPVVYLSPQGKKLDQKELENLSTFDHLILVAGRYEGIDERVVEQDIDYEYSIGDYVLSGGEIPAMVLIDGLTRLLPGALGDDESAQRESFVDGLLDYPQYTRPEQVENHRVPEILLSGNHAEIEKWRMKQALGRTFRRRPDLMNRFKLSPYEAQLLDEFIEENPNLEK